MANWTHDPPNNNDNRLSFWNAYNAEGAQKIAAALNTLLADVFTLYLSGPHFRDYHLLLDEQADQIFAMTEAIAVRVRKIGGRIWFLFDCGRRT